MRALGLISLAVFYGALLFGLLWLLIPNGDLADTPMKTLISGIFTIGLVVFFLREEA